MTDQRGPTVHVQRPAGRGSIAPRVVLAGVFLPVAIVGALVLSASATVDLFTSQGVSPSIVWAAVLMVEVTVLSGTLLWLLVRKQSLRRDARLVTFGATAVTLIAGWHAYGPVGLTAGVGAVAVTHLASRAWREPWTQPVPATEAQESPTTVADAVAERAATSQHVGHDSAVDDVPAEASVAPDVEADESTAEVVNIHRTPQPPSTWPHGLPVWKKAVASARGGMGRPTLCRTYGIKQAAAKHVLDAVKKEREQAA